VHVYFKLLDESPMVVDQNPKMEKVINYIMRSGKKSVARGIYNDMLQEIKASGHMNPIVVVEAAIENASPIIMIKSKRL
jgi:small subunit ribosomal protein S7